MAQNMRESCLVTESDDDDGEERTKTTMLEFIPGANAWKVGDDESAHMSTVRGYSTTLDTTPPRVRRALDRKKMKKDAWKQAILEFRSIHAAAAAAVIVTMFFESDGLMERGRASSELL